MSHLPTLTLETLKIEAKRYTVSLSQSGIPSLFGVTDGKRIGTYVEQEFRDYLAKHYAFMLGNSALGIDFPELGIDLKVTSITQPQSSCPYRNASQKIYGLGYSLLIIVYNKADNVQTRSAHLAINHVVYIAQEHTADHQTTFGLLEIIRRDGNVDDLAAFLEERNLPLDEVGREQLAQRILSDPPRLGVLTISNALQWRLQYTRAISVAAQQSVAGVENLLA